MKEAYKIFCTKKTLITFVQQRAIIPQELLGEKIKKYHNNITFGILHFIKAATYIMNT